ncbi:MAG: D-2-hydroxyacid dehydrogenase [Novosphingobium sp.]|nr:D-2-hydroxyacid dehydrogenase [Novosphingobium sp.]
MTIAVLNAFTRRFVEGRLPAGIEPYYFANGDELRALVPKAEIGWFDSFDGTPVREILELAENLKWLNTLAAGVDFFPLDLLGERNVTLTNSAGLNSITIAEYAVMGMLVIAKGYREVVRSQERREWLADAPGKLELFGSKALIIGAGGIGGRTAELLKTWDVDVTMVRRNPAPGVLTADQWRARLGEFDWVVIAVPSTADTDKMMSQAEFAAMKPGAAVLNFSRGPVIDQDALMAAVTSGQVGGAFLDVTDPEPLPSDHPLWGFDNVHITSHLSGRSQTRLIERSAERFIENVTCWERGELLAGVVDLSLGY